MYICTYTLNKLCRLSLAYKSLRNVNLDRNLNANVRGLHEGCGGQGVTGIVEGELMRENRYQLFFEYDYILPDLALVGCFAIVIWEYMTYVCR